MKVLSVVLFCVLAVAVSAANQCPVEQETDWEIEKLLAHEDCDKFYKCSYGKPIEMPCPKGLLFNVELGQCDWDENVDCGDRNIPEADDGDTEGDGEADGDGGSDGDGGADGDDGADGDGGAGGDGEESVDPCEAGSEETPDFETLENGCPLNTTIHWLLPSEGSCSEFYYCLNGELVLMNCPSTLHFNRRLQVCDLPLNACCAQSFDKHLPSRLQLLKK
ncbi:unnamed protein product, partial [Iphiclides podalirius]